MHRFSFKAHHVRPIAERSKTDTVRPLSAAFPGVGERFTCHVNVGRPAFAVCTVIGFDFPTLAELRTEDAAHAAEVEATYGVREKYLRIRFVLTEFRLDELRRQNLSAVREWIEEIDAAGDNQTNGGADVAASPHEGDGDAEQSVPARATAVSRPRPPASEIQPATDGVVADGVAVVHAPHSIPALGRKVAICLRELATRSFPVPLPAGLLASFATCCSPWANRSRRSPVGSAGPSKHSAGTSKAGSLRRSSVSPRPCAGPAAQRNSGGRRCNGSIPAGP